MRHVNEITVSGNLGDAPAFSADGKRATLSVATNRQFTTRDGEKKEDTQWHRVSVRGRLALTCHELRKGSRVLIMGEARSYSYQDDDQRTVWIHEIDAHTVALVLMPPKEDAPAQPVTPAANV